MACCTGRSRLTGMLLRRLCGLHSSSWSRIAHNYYFMESHRHAVLTSRVERTRLTLESLAMMSTVSPSTRALSKDSSRLCRDSVQFSNPVELLDEVNKELVQDCCPDDVASYIVQTGHCQLQFLRKTVPWLECSYHTGHRQLVMSNELEKVNRCVIEHHAFVGLCASLEQCYKECSSEHLAYSLLMLLYLGYNPEDALMHKLLLEVRSRVPQMDLRDLSIVSRVYAAMPMADPTMARLVMAHVPGLIDSGRVLSPEELTSLCILVSRMSRVLTADGMLAFFRTVQRLIKDPMYLASSRHLENTSLALIKIPERLGLSRQDVGSVAEPLKEAALRHLDGLSIRSLRSVCNTVQYLRWQYDDDFRTRCERRALSLLGDGCSAREITNLLTACNARTDRQVVSTLVDRLHDEIQNMDGHLVGCVARCFNEINPHHIGKDTLSKLQRRAVELGESFFNYSGMLANSLASLFTRRPILDEEDQSRLRVFFIQYLRCMDLDLRYVSSVLLYLMLVPDGPGLPEAVFEKMMSAVGQWNMRHVTVTMFRLNTLSGTVSSRCQRQIEMLRVVFQMRFLELLPKVASLNELCSVTRRVIQTSRDPALLDDAVIQAVCDKYRELSTPDVDETTLNEVAAQFIQFKYYLPRLFDDLVHSANRMDVSLKMKTYPRLLQLLGQVGYKPKEFDQFVKGVLDAWRECHSRQHYKTMIFVLNYLSRFQCFPEEELKHVFSIEFLQTVDKEVKREHNRMRNGLMMLNRACVIDYPQLGIPWFHEHYCRRNFKAPKNPISALIRSPLEKVLGGEHYVSVNVFSQYYYFIDFECVLDENTQPIHKIVTDYGVKDSWQRIAILVQTQAKFCSNSKELDGFNQVKLRHLKSLGYKVIQIPYYEWNSLGAADFEGQCEYLRKKIFTS